jgi:hypothetical protein
MHRYYNLGQPPLWRVRASQPEIRVAMNGTMIEVAVEAY